jgi:hypothetical protein
LFWKSVPNVRISLICSHLALFILARADVLGVQSAQHANGHGEEGAQEEEEPGVIHPPSSLRRRLGLPSRGDPAAKATAAEARGRDDQLRQERAPKES